MSHEENLGTVVLKYSEDFREGWRGSCSIAVCGDGPEFY